MYINTHQGNKMKHHPIRKYRISNQPRMGNYYSVSQALRHSAKVIDGKCGVVTDDIGRVWVWGPGGRAVIDRNN